MSTKTRMSYYIKIGIIIVMSRLYIKHEKSIQSKHTI